MSYNVVVVFCCCDCNRDISDLGVSGTLGYLLSDLMSLRKLYFGIFPSVFVGLIFVL